MRVLAIALCIGLGPSPDTFDELVEQGREHFEAEHYAEAAAALERAHALTPDDDVLFNWANAERLAGQCPRAIELYDRYIAHQGEREQLDELSLRYLDVAVERRQECVARQPDEPPSPDSVSEPEPVQDEPIERPAQPQVGPSETEPAEPVEELDDRVRRAPDAWGWATTGVGIAAFGAGTTMVAVAYARDANATDQPSHGAYLERVEQSSRLSIAGWAVMGVGAAAMIAGAVRLAVVRKRARSATRASLGLGSVRVRF